MCGDVLFCARAESDADCAAPVYAAVPTAPHAGSLGVKLDGTSRNRTADAGSAAREQIARSSPAEHRELFPKPRLGADPRAPPRRTARQRPAPPPAARAPAGDTGNSGDDGTRGHLPSSAMPGWHANTATGPLHPDTPDCNTAPAATGAQRTARTPSTDSDAASAPDKSLALKKIVDHDEVDPRERQLPKVKSRRGSQLLSETLYIRCLILRHPSAPG
jgi:hypothetical protein